MFHRQSRKPAFLAIALMLAVCLSACSKDPYTASMAASLDISNGVNDALTTLTALRQSDLITQAEMAQYATYLGNLTTLNGVFRTSVKTIHSNAAAPKSAYIAAASTFVVNANNPTVLAALHVVNPQAQAKVQTFMLAISTALNGIQVAISQAKGA